MNHQYDVIVVGGSVSGAPTATWLARKGHKVLVLEKTHFPRDANSTHFIWPRGMSYLNRLGVVDEILAVTPKFTHLEVSIEGISLHGRVPPEAIKTRFQALHGDAEGVVDFYAGPRRFHLDQVLLQNARKSGVEVREGIAVKDVILSEQGSVVGVIATDGDGREYQIYARCVVGADGRMSQFANHVNAQKVTVREKSTFAYYGYFSGIEKPELCIHKRGRLGTAIFPTQDNTHLALVYGPTAWWTDFSRDAEANFFKAYEFVAPDVAALVRAGHRTEPFKAMGRMVAFHRENWGQGWAMVGDAGSFKDQWTAMGITHSLRDAELISGYIDRFLRKELSWQEAMSVYTEVRAADYDAYWDFVCDGAECKPYTRDQLAFFHQVQRCQDRMDHFMGQVGDTIPFSQAVDLGDAPAPLPAFIESFDSVVAGYHHNPFLVPAHEDVPYAA